MINIWRSEGWSREEIVEVISKVNLWGGRMSQEAIKNPSYTQVEGRHDLLTRKK